MEVVAVEGTVTGSVIHFHLIRTMIVPSSGLISASALGMPFALSFFREFLHVICKFICI